jgi:Tfp pilus assembly protein FimT
MINKNEDFRWCSYLRERCLKGITLFEVLVMLVVVGILAIVAVPSFVTLINRYRISSTAQNLYYALQEARSEAVKRNANVYLAFNPGSTWCYGINAGATCDCTTAGSCGIGTKSYLSANQITLSATGYSNNYVYFEGTHGAAQNSGSITLTLYGQSSYIKISISALGNLSMCSSGISGFTAC